MKKYFFIKDRDQSKRNNVIPTNRPISSFELLFEDLDQDDSATESWLMKSRRLQARRWRKFKREALM